MWNLFLVVFVAGSVTPITYLHQSSPFDSIEACEAIRDATESVFAQGTEERLGLKRGRDFELATVCVPLIRTTFH